MWEEEDDDLTNKEVSPLTDFHEAFTSFNSSTTTCTNATKYYESRQEKKEIQFGSVQVRSYDLWITDDHDEDENHEEEKDDGSLFSSLRRSLHVGNQVEQESHLSCSISIRKDVLSKDLLLDWTYYQHEEEQIDDYEARNCSFCNDKHCIVFDDSDFLQKAAEELELTSPEEARKKKKKKEVKSVTFGIVQIRQFDLIVGHNPSTRKGPSIDFDWTFEELQDIPLDQFEMRRKEIRRSPCSNKEKLFLLPQDRKKILRKWGYTKKDFRKARNDVSAIRKQMKKTIKEEMKKVNKEQRQLQMLLRRSA